MKWKWVVPLFCLASLLLAACQMGSNSEPAGEPLAIVKKPLTRSESLLHTAVQLSIYHDGQEEVMDEAIAYIKEMEALLSTNLEGSDVYRINQAAGQGAVVVDERTVDIIEQALEMSQLSGGKFDIAIGAISNLWKIGSDEARKPSEAEIAAALPLIHYDGIQLDRAKQTVEIQQGMVLELGAISKGYIADKVAELFASKGITTAIINLGGNVVVMGTSPTHTDGWQVGVQDPDEVRGETVGSVPVTNGSIVTSGIYERYLEVDGTRYHHILDPATGYPVENEISGVTVFSDRSVQGDALSTTLFLLGIEKGLEFVHQLEGVEAVFIDKDRGVHLSQGLRDRFELTNEEYHLVSNQ